jgi:hypothetical protein
MEHADDIDQFLQYVEAQTLRLTVFRVLPLDWALPVTLVNLCISYQIIIVQITHLL